MGFADATIESIRRHAPHRLQDHDQSVYANMPPSMHGSTACAVRTLSSRAAGDAMTLTGDLACPRRRLTLSSGGNWDPKRIGKPTRRTSSRAAQIDHSLDVRNHPTGTIIHVPNGRSSSATCPTRRQHSVLAASTACGALGRTVPARYIVSSLLRRLTAAFTARIPPTVALIEYDAVK